MLGIIIPGCLIVAMLIAVAAVAAEIKYGNHDEPTKETNRP